jgi:hypothetical protein
MFNIIAMWSNFMRQSLAGFVLLTIACAVTAQTTVPYSFTAGTPAQAAQVNADFQSLAGAINSGIPGYEIIGPTMFTVPVPTGSGNFFQYSVSCSAGKYVLSGGYLLNGYAAIVQSSPVNNSGWEVGVITNAASTMNLYVYAICALAHP